MATLWAADQPMTANEVHAVINGGLAYTTVVTALSRLYAKGVLTRQPVGRAFAYVPVTDQPGLAARRMREVLDAERDRTSVLSRFVSGLSAPDEHLLRQLLNRAE